MMRHHDKDLCGPGRFRRMGVCTGILLLQALFVLCVIVLATTGRLGSSGGPSGGHGTMSLAALPGLGGQSSQITLNVEHLHVHPESMDFSKITLPTLSMASAAANGGDMIEASASPSLASSIAARLAAQGLPAPSTPSISTDEDRSSDATEQRDQSAAAEQASVNNVPEETNVAPSSMPMGEETQPIASSESNSMVSASSSDSSSSASLTLPSSSSFTTSVTDRFGSALTCDESALAQPVHKYRIYHKVGSPFELYAHDPSIDEAISGAFALGWLYESGEHAAIAARLRAVDNLMASNTPVLYVDVGSNIGNHILPLALGGVAHEYHGFEASLHNYRLLACSGVLHREELNGAPMVLNHLAVVDANDAGSQVCMLSDPRNQGHTFVRGMDPYVELRLAANNDPERIKALFKDTSDEAKAALQNDAHCQWAPTVTLDSYWETTLTQRRIGLLKLDIEGYEGKALAGARRMMQQQPPFYVALELLPKHVRRSGVDPAQLVADMFAYGYSLDPSSDKAAPHARIDSLTYEQAKDMIDQAKLPPNLHFTHRDAKKLDD